MPPPLPTKYILPLVSCNTNALLGEEGVIPNGESEYLRFMVESVFTENTHVVMRQKPYVGWYGLDHPVLKSVGKQVFNYEIWQHRNNFNIYYLYFLVLSSVSREQGKTEVKTWNLILLL